MEPLEREDSSTYVNRSQEQPEAPQPVQKVEPPKQKKSRVAGILALLLLLALVSVAALGWLWYQQNGRIANLESDLSVARNDVARLESVAKAEEKLDDDSTITTDTDSADSDAVIKAALAYTQAPAKPLTNQKAEVKYLKDNFAKVTVTTGATGSSSPSFAVTLKKSSDQWVVLNSTSGPMDPSDMTDLMNTYGIPKEAF